MKDQRIVCGLILCFAALASCSPDDTKTVSRSPRATEEDSRDVPVQGAAPAGPPPAADSGGPPNSTPAPRAPASTGSASGAASAQCDELAACCQTLTGDPKTNCEGVRAANDGSACATAITTLCTAAPPAAEPAPAAQPTAPVPTDPCSALRQCCATLDDDDDTEDCDEVAADADAAACTEASTEYACPNTPPTTTPTMPGSDPCGALRQCCATLDDDDDIEDCDEVADDADAAACTEASTEYACPSTTTPAMPTAPGSDACVALSRCCTMLSDEEDQEDCMSVVEEADADSCTEASEELCMSSPGMPPAPDDD